MRTLDLVEKRLLGFLVILLALTFISSEGIGRLAGGGSRNVLLSVMLVLTLIKVRIVVMHFMELNYAPRAARIVANCWLGGLLLALVGVMELHF